MMNNFKFGALTSEAQLLKSPQDGFKNCETDFTSIFGTQKNTFLKEVPIKRDVENNDTPFSFNAMIYNVFDNISEKDLPMQNRGGKSIQPLHFEC